jgi:RNA polymerase sigma-70 factor, ECF subfamily
MDRYAAGDAAAFDELYDALAPRLHRLLIVRVRDPERANELLQEVMLRIHQARGSFIPGAQVRPWAYAIAERLAINDARRRRRAPPVSGGDPDTHAPPAAEPTPEDLAHWSEIAARLQAGVARLPPSLRVAFELVRDRGLSLAQTAVQLGITVGAAKVRVHRACGLLRPALDPEAARERTR